MTGDGPLANLHLALVHWPVVDRAGALIHTATTNLDIHDIARAATTYGAAGYWLVQPLEAQFDMIGRILRHWREGPGSRSHPDRPQALAGVRVVREVQEIGSALGDVTWVATTANPTRPTTSLRDFGARLRGSPSRPHVLLFGTGWGLAPQVLAAANVLLDPIRAGAYTHLSVRSAAAIYLDRIWQATRESG